MNGVAAGRWRGRKHPPSRRSAREVERGRLTRDTPRLRIAQSPWSDARARRCRYSLPSAALARDAVFHDCQGRAEPSPHASGGFCRVRGSVGPGQLTPYSRFRRSTNFINDPRARWVVHAAQSRLCCHSVLYGLIHFGFAWPRGIGLHFSPWRELYSLRKSGAELPLTWAPFIDSGVNSLH